MRLRSALCAVRYRGAVTANSSLRFARLIMTSLPSSSLAIDISGRWYDSLMRQRFCQSKILREAIRYLDLDSRLCYTWKQEESLSDLPPIEFEADLHTHQIDQPFSGGKPCPATMKKPSDTGSSSSLKHGISATHPRLPRCLAKTAIVQDMAKDHATVFRESQLMTNAGGVRFLRPDVAVAHVTCELTGLLGRDGQKLPWVARGIMTWMLKKDDRTWRIAAFQNTRIEAPPPDLLVE